MSGALGPRRILVTGAAGFIGRRVTQQLRDRGDTVVALVRPGAADGVLGAIQADICGDFSQTLRDIGAVDGVVHLAQAPGWHAFPEGAGAIAAASVAAACRLAEHASRVGAGSFVLASSGGVHGPSPEPIREESPIRPAAELGFYLAAKSAAEGLLAYFSDTLSVRALRLFFVYGPGQSPAFLVPRLIRNVDEGNPIRLASGRGPMLNPIYVDDAARAVVAACDASRAITVNVAGSETVSLAQIVQMIGKLRGRTPVLDITSQVPDDFVADIACMREWLGAPLDRLETGLPATLEARA